MSRSLALQVMPVVLLGLLLGLSGGVAHAQDTDGLHWVAAINASQTTTTTPDGFTVWRKEIYSGCSYQDHQYSLDIQVDTADVSEVSYAMNNYDVDYGDPQGCPGGSEVDIMYFNGQLLGFLAGASDSWSQNAWSLSPSQLVSGANTIFIDTDAPGTGCWCVGVGYIEVRAKVGFKVKDHTPKSDDKNRDFRADKVDLTVTFSTEYDPGTLTNSTFLLEYRDATGAWQPVAGAFNQLAPEKFRFTPGANLKDGVRYRATVKGGASGVKSKAGGTLTGDEVWYFHTVPDLSVTDSFDYGSGSLCPPSSQPCPGVELAVFQVARNASMVPDGKEALARLYLRWKRHTDVHPDDQLLQTDVDASITVDGTTHSTRATVKRPDRYSAAEREAAAHTVNIKHTPRSAFSYSVEVKPFPQSNAVPVAYTQTLNLNSTGRSPSIAFNYYFLKDGPWLAGVPAPAKTDGTAIMTAGAQLITDMFPVLGTTYRAKGDFTIGYTYTGANVEHASCDTVQQVDCPGFLGATRMAEVDCVYDKLRSMRGGVFGVGADKFVSATVPGVLCPGINGLRIGNTFMHMSGSRANASTIGHEVGHVYGLGHRDIHTGIEGYQVRTGINRSFVENPARAISLMTTVGQPTEVRWIDNTDYAHLVGAVTFAGAIDSALKADMRATGPYLIVSGFVDLGTHTARLSPSFLQQLPNDAPSSSGTCLVELLDGTGAVLASDFVTPGVDTTVEYTDGSSAIPHSVETSGPQPFSVSLPWNESARQLRLSCNGAVLLTQARSTHAPVVDFVGLFNGENLSGTRSLSWMGSDADDTNLAYQFQVSQDGGATWTPLTPLVRSTSFSFDTTLEPSGSAMLRVMVTDGFNTAWAERTVTIVNPLKVLGVMPALEEEGVDPHSTVGALFVTDVDPSTLSSATFQLLVRGSRVAGKVSYDPATRMATFTPAAPLGAQTRYMARLLSSIRDVRGNTLGSTNEWSFTTAADTTPPVVVRTSPDSGQLGIPLNGLVQVDFSENMSPSSLTTSSFQLLDAAGGVVSGQVVLASTQRSAIFIPAAPLAPETRYTVRLASSITDAANNSLENEYTWPFTTGTTQSNGVRIVGNYSDQAFDVNGDGLYDNLTLSVDVEVLRSEGYNLNARLLDKTGTVLGWQTTGSLYLERGVHTLKLVFSGVPIRSNGVDGPYTLDAVNFYRGYDPSNSDVRYKAYQTDAYRASSFYSALTLGKLPPQLLEWNTLRENAFNLRDYTSHVSLPTSSVSYRILINTDPRVGVSIDSEGYVDIRPAAGLELESDVLIQASDTLGNRVTSTFHISVQQPRPSKLVVPDELSLAPLQSQTIDVQVKDQWERLLTSSVTVTFATTVGTIAPDSVTTSTGLASTTLTAGSTSGVGFVTTRVGALSALTRIKSAAPLAWHRTSNMGSMRALHEAVRLEDGRVLTVGGWNTSTELYDPATGTWLTTGPLSRTRRYFTLTSLADGRVLAAGGDGGEEDATAEVYEPATRTWRITGSMAVARKDHTATRLANGKVLVAGGAGSDGTAELYDPATGTWSRTGAMLTARSLHTATLLGDGTVLITGGIGAAGGPLASSELYDPATGTWRSLGEMSVARRYHTATPLPSGQVLVAGGGPGPLANTAEVYDPTTGTWSRTGAMVQPRRYHTATPLPSGQVLVAGGYDDSTGIHTAAELFDPATGTWRATASMNVARYNHAATPLADGGVLVSGGQSNGDQASAEIFGSAGL